LLHDPRVSSDPRRNPQALAAAAAAAGVREAGENVNAEEVSEASQSFLLRDPPDHDRLRRLTMRHFGPPNAPRRVTDLEPRMLEIVTELIDGMEGRSRVDLVEDLAYPFPVSVICELLGVPAEDKPRFRVWVDMALESTDPTLDAETRMQRQQEAGRELNAYMGELVAAHRKEPGDDMLQRLREDPDLAIPMVEELLRYEPPVHFIPFRTAIDDIDIAGITIPKGSAITLALAAGNRDPRHVADPDRFIPTGRTIPTSASVAASTFASARRWPGWRPKPP